MLWAVKPSATATVHSATRPALAMDDNLKRRLRHAGFNRTNMVPMALRIKSNFGEKKAPGPNTWLRTLLPPVCTGLHRLFGSRKAVSLLDDSDRAAVLAPAGNVVADRHRAFLAEGLAGDALLVDAARHEIVHHHRGAAGAQRDIVFASAALVGMAFDHDAVVLVLVEPGRLLVQRGRSLGGQRTRIRFEEHAVTRS